MIELRVWFSAGRSFAKVRLDQTSLHELVPFQMITMPGQDVDCWFNPSISHQALDSKDGTAKKLKVILQAYFAYRFRRYKFWI